MRPLLCILVLCSIIACHKNADESTEPNLEGTYAGIFTRTGMDTASVMLTLNQTTFSGQSDKIKYPAICHGSYEVVNQSIRFTDSCAWTADFDWSLILNGNYSFSQDNGELKISRTNGANTDEYRLRRMVR